MRPHLIGSEQRGAGDTHPVHGIEGVREEVRVEGVKQGVGRW